MTDKPDVAELVEVTQADIDALHAAYTEQWGKPALAVYNADHWLAKAFARHRIATRAEGRREGIEAAAKVADDLWDRVAGNSERKLHHRMAYRQVAASIRARLMEEQND